MKRTIITVTLIAFLGIFAGTTSAFAEDLFSDTFTGTVLDTDTKWPDWSTTHGALSQNNELIYTADTSNKAFSFYVASSSFVVDSGVDSLLFKGTWSATSLKNTNSFYFTLQDSDANKLKIGYVAGTGLGYWTGTTFNSLAAYKSTLPTTPTNFALTVNATGWTYSENGTAIYTSASSPLGTIPSTYTLTLGMSGSSTAGAAGQVMKVDNISISPEPMSAALFVIGGGALAFIRRRKA